MVVKPTTAKAPAKKPAVSRVSAGKAVAADANGEADSEATGKVVAQLRVKDLVDRVVTAVDQSRKDVKIIVEAALAELSKALDGGEMLNLPPLGKLRIANQRSDETGLAMTLKLRRNSEKNAGKKADKEALAEAGEAG